MVFICRYFFKNGDVCDLCTVVFFIIKKRVSAKMCLSSSQQTLAGHDCIHTSVLYRLYRCIHVSAYLRLVAS